MATRRAILERLERGLTKDLRRLSRRLEIVRRLIALEREDDAGGGTSSRHDEAALVETACGLIAANGGEIHIRELEAQLAELADERWGTSLYALLAHHPERIAPRPNGFLTLASAPPRRRSVTSAPARPLVIQSPGTDAGPTMRHPRLASKQRRPVARAEGRLEAIPVPAAKSK